MGGAKFDGLHDGSLWTTLVWIGGAMHSLRHLIVYIQRTWPSTRGHLQEAWSVLSRWEELEAVEHRRPVPKALVDAMCVLGLS